MTEVSTRLPGHELVSGGIADLSAGRVLAERQDGAHSRYNALVGRMVDSALG